MQRRTLVKAAPWVALAIGAGIGVVPSLLEEDISLDTYRKFLAEKVRKGEIKLEGKDVTKEFKLPYFRDVNTELSQVTLKIPVSELEKQVEFDRPHSWQQTIDALTQPSEYLVDLMRQVDTDKHENLLNRQGFGKAYFDTRLLDIFKVLAFVKENITYISDDSNGDAKRAQSNPYYNRQDYWKFPEQTLIDGFGDCDDFTVTAAGMLKSYWANKSDKRLDGFDTGVCILSGSASRVPHAILAVSADVSILDGIMLHYNEPPTDTTDKTNGKFPHIYAAKGNFPHRHVSECMSCELKPNEPVLLLFEPQRYYSNAAGVRINDYSDKTAIFPTKKINLERDFVHVKPTGWTMDIKLEPYKS